MLDINAALDGTLPRVKNASTAYIKVLNLKVNEYVDIQRFEIPSSYPTITPITYYIKKRYGYQLHVADLENKKGWRVIRVESLEVLKSFSNFRTKLHTMENPTPTKNHNLSDADLAQMIDQKIALANRDAADLVPRGVTATRLSDLQTANNDFKKMPSDAELESDVGIAVNAKNTARSAIESRIGNVRTMVQNIFGEESPEYRGFNFKGMISLRDNDLTDVSNVVYKRAVKYQAELLSEGCTPTFLADMETEVKAFDDSLEDVRMAETNRLEGTGQRIKAGNAIYTEVDKICNTAKDVYRETNPIKHDEYLIYPTPSGEKTATRSGNLTANQVVNINVEGIESTSNTHVLIESELVPLRFYSSATPAGPETGGHIDLDAGTEADYAFADFVSQLGFNDTNQYLNVENKAATNGKYRIRFTKLV